jgi:hypothetical protein
VLAQPTRAGEGQTGSIAVFKTMCQDFGQQDTCNGRDTSLNGYHIDYTVEEWDEGAGDLVETIVVTLGDNAGGGGNLGGGSQGRNVGGDLPVGDYLVCEIEVAYLDDDEVPLDALPRPEAGNGGSTGGSQEEIDGNCIIVELTAGTAELKFLDQALDRGSLLVLKTNNALTPIPLAGAVFSLIDNEDNPVGSPQTTGTDGMVCFDDLALETDYTVTETTPPPGYQAAVGGPQTVTVVVVGDCDDRGGAEDEADAVFTNALIVEEQELGGTGTPAQSLPNTSLGLSGSGSLATIFFGAILIASLGALAYANVTAVRRRR